MIRGQHQYGHIKVGTTGGESNLELFLQAVRKSGRRVVDYWREGNSYVVKLTTPKENK